VGGAWQRIDPRSSVRSTQSRVARTSDRHLERRSHPTAARRLAQVDAKNKALAALAAIGDTSADAFINAMKLAVISFASGSAEIPPASRT
jgi:hypothetical protein